VCGRTAGGGSALDLPAAVRASLERHDVRDVEDLGLSTAADDYFSHRLRGEAARHALVAWIEP
jgi:copper oxidase (laccase) domain-containing protein